MLLYTDYLLNLNAKAMDNQYTTALIDADYLIYHAAWASRDMPQAGATQLRDQIGTLLETLAPNVEHASLYATSKEEPPTGFMPRLQIYAPIQVYKGNRKDDPAVAEAKHWLRESLMEWCISVPGFEADDLIHSATQIVEHQDSLLIVSTDKDLDQIPGWHYNPVKRVEYHVTAEDARYNYWLRVLMGDTTDHIRGVPGCGPKGGAKLLYGCREEMDFHKAVRDEYVRVLGREQGIIEFDITMRVVKLWNLMDPIVQRRRHLRTLMSEL